MARNVATFVVDVVSKGLKQARDQVTGLGQGARNAAASYNHANSAAGGFYQTQAKGVIGTANSTKSFSKLAETMNSGSGIVGAYATLAANIFAVSAAFNALRGAAQVQQLQQGLEAMGNRMGTTLSVAAANMREISGYTLTAEQSLRATANIASAGFGTQSMENLAKVANDVSVALGRNMTDSMDRLTRGVVKLEPELLDELGLMTKIGESSANYARELGKSESQLSNFEKRQGFMNAIVAEGQAKFGGLADAAGETRNLDRLAATFSDLTKEILSFINIAALPLSAIFSNKGVLIAGMILFASTISRQLLPGLSNLSVKTAKSAQDLAQVAKTNFTDIPTAVTEPRGVKALRGAIANDRATPESYQKALNAITLAENKLTQEIAAGGSKRKAYSKLSVDGLKEELGVLQDQRKLINDTANLQAQAAAKTTGANAILLAGEKKVLASMVLTKKATLDYRNALDQAAVAQGRLGMMTGILNNIRAGFFGAAIGARALGAALTSMMGTIGLLIAAGSMLYAAWQWVKEWWEGPAVKRYNEALAEQADILGQLKNRYEEMQRVRAQNIPIAAREQAVYKVMTNTVRENIEAYEKVKVAQDAVFAKRNSVKVGDTAEFKTLKELRNFGGPEIRKQIDEALGEKGLTGILKNANKEIDKGTLEKLSKILRDDLRQGAVTLGDHINDLAEAFKTADQAIADFNRSAIPSTPYDNVVKNMDSVSNALQNITTNAARSDDFMARLAQTMTSAGPNVRSLFTTDTQRTLTEYEMLDTRIQKAGDSAKKVDIDRKEALQQILAIRSSEIMEVQELFASAQRVARQTESAIALEQTRLNQLNRYTALTGSSIRDRRAAENKILQLQASQLASQAEIVKRQLAMTIEQIEFNKRLLESNELYQKIKASIGEVGVASNKTFQDEIVRRIQLLRQEKDANDGIARIWSRSDEQIDQELVALEELVGQRQKINSLMVESRDKQDQLAASSAQQAAILGNQTSAAVVNAEANAQNAQTLAESSQKQVDLQTQMIKNSKILSDIEVKRRGRARSVAEEYALMVNEASRLTVVQQTAIANQANAEVQQMRVQQAAAAGNAAEVAAYQSRINLTLQLADARMAEIDRQNQLNILEKFSFDIHKEGLEMQKSSLDYLENQLDAQAQYVALQREGRNLTAEIARRRSGRAANDFTDRTQQIAEAREQLKLAQQQAAMRKAVINLEYALLEAQRQQMVWNLEAQRKILGENSEQGKQLAIVIGNLNKGAAAVQAGQASAVASVDENIRNLAKKLEILGLGEGRNFVGSGLRDFVESRRAMEKARNVGANAQAAPIAEALETYISPLEASNQVLVNSQGELTSATRDLSAQLRAAATAPIPEIQQAVGSIVDAGKMAQKMGLSVKENDAFGWMRAGRKASDRQGHSRNSAHYRNAAIDINAPGVGVEANHSKWGPIFDRLAQQYRDMGFKVLWKTAGHYNHMHVEMTDRVVKSAQRLGVKVTDLVQVPIQAATEAIEMAQATMPAAPTAAANDNNNITVTGTRKPPRTPRDLESLVGMFGQLTQNGDFNMMQVFEEMADKLGPEGTIVTSIISGISNVGSAIVNFQKVMNDSESSFGDKFAAGATIAQTALGTIQSVLTAATDAKIANIDREIAAEQKRDGKSAESIAKIQAMERRKDSIQRKAFNTNKKLMMAQAVIATAAGVAQALTLGPIVGPIMAAVIGALGAAQLAIISGTSYQSTANANFDQKSMPSTLTIGKRGDGVDLARQNPNLGGELGYLRGTKGTGTNSSNYAPIGSAYGGPLPRGYGHNAFVVGEKGPEVIERDTPVNVRPLNDVNDNRPISANIQISAWDGASVHEMLSNRRGDIIDLLREAANANGTRFLEDVNTSHYKKAGSSGATRI